jgi:diguanylate cyclase (GGDEF)-like protein
VRISGQRGTVRVTISVGVASWPEHGEEITRLLERADKRLYEAKLAGRDQVKGPGAEAVGRAAMRLPARMRIRPT